MRESPWSHNNITFKGIFHVPALIKKCFKDRTRKINRIYTRIRLWKFGFSLYFRFDIDENVKAAGYKHAFRFNFVEHRSYLNIGDWRFQFTRNLVIFYTDSRKRIKSIINITLAFIRSDHSSFSMGVSNSYLLGLNN